MKVYHSQGTRHKAQGTIYWIVVLGLLGVGVVGSIKEYRDWKYQETHRYGYGWEADRELAAAQKLAGPYQNNPARIRLRYPQAWDITENPKSPFGSAQGKQSNDYEVVKFASPFTLNASGKKSQIALGSEDYRGGLADRVREEVKKIEARGIKLDREWEYFNGKKMGFTVITWQEGEWMHQKALGEAGGRLITITVDCEQQMWKGLAKTFEEVYKSVVLF